MRCWIVLFILCTCHCSAAEPDLAALVAALGDTQFKQRIAAEKTLRELSAEVLPQLTPYLETDDIEVRNRLKNIVEYIRDHGPQGVQTLTDVIMNPEVERPQRGAAIQELCSLAALGNDSALLALSRIAGNATLGLVGQEANVVRTEIMVGLQEGMLAMGPQAVSNKGVEGVLLKALDEPLLRSFAIRALGEAAAGGNAAALEALVKPESYGMNLSQTINALRNAVRVGDKGTLAALQTLVANGSESDLFQVALTIQAGGSASGKNAIPILKAILERSTNGVAAERALAVVESVLLQQQDHAEAAALVETWRPKVQQMLGNRARGTTTIRIGQ